MFFNKDFWHYPAGKINLQLRHRTAPTVLAVPERREWHSLSLARFA
jgi:hypothetical protein